MSVLTSRQNPLCVHLRKLAAQGKYRREAGEYLADGQKLWQEAVRWKAPVRRLITTPEIEVEVPQGVEHTVVSPQLMEYISPMETPQGVLFTVSLPNQEQPILEGSRYLALDGLQDPGNIGTIWRAADALGADGILLLNHCADPYGPKVVRSTMGACFRLPVWETSLPQLTQCLGAQGLSLYAAALEPGALKVGETNLDRCCVVIGNEGHGVSRAVLDACRGTLFIPMRARCESLNAASAATIILWEMAQTP